MTDDAFALYQLVKEDGRFPIEAYMFVREALAYAADSLALGETPDSGELVDPDDEGRQVRRERHLTGQQLCESIREYALQQFGYMTRVVLKNWNVETTGHFGDIVYNMIDIGIMKKSSADQRSDFDAVYEFEIAFDSEFVITGTVAQGRGK